MMAGSRRKLHDDARAVLQQAIDKFAPAGATQAGAAAGAPQPGAVGGAGDSIDVAPAWRDWERYVAFRKQAAEIFEVGSQL